MSFVARPSTVTVLDDAVVRWLADLDAPGLRATMEVLAAPASWAAITALLWGLLLALLVLRRVRHLLVVLVRLDPAGVLIQYVLAPLMRRPRPFGVESGPTGWPGRCRPSRWRRSR